MKIIEAMKRIKHLQEKCADLRAKVALYCAAPQALRSAHGIDAP